MDLDLRSTWHLPPPSRVRTPDRSTNNELLLIDAGDRLYVVRAYQNLAVTQIEREHALCSCSRGPGLNLAVPVPVRLPDGRTMLTGDRYTDPSGSGSATIRPYRGDTPSPVGSFQGTAQALPGSSGVGSFQGRLSNDPTVSG